MNVMSADELESYRLRTEQVYRKLAGVLSLLGASVVALLAWADGGLEWIHLITGGGIIFSLLALGSLVVVDWRDAANPLSDGELATLKELCVSSTRAASVVMARAQSGAEPVVGDLRLARQAAQMDRRDGLLRELGIELAKK